MAHATIAHLVLLVLLLVFPWWDRWETRRMTHAHTSGTGGKSASYVRIIGGLWVTAGVVMALIPVSELLRAPDGPIPLLHSVPGAMVGAVTGGLLIGLLMPLLLAAVQPAARARVIAAFEPIAYMLPRSGAESALFAGVSLSAGICEEVIYRGFLIRYLQNPPWHLSLGAGLLLSCVIFGIAHAGQGWRGVIGTALIGLFLGALYLASGSLWLAIGLHALIDLRVLAIVRLQRGNTGDSRASC